MTFRTKLKYFSNGQFSEIDLITKDGEIIIQSSMLCLLWPDVGELAAKQADVSKNVSVFLPDITIEDVEIAIEQIIETCQSNPFGSI